MVRTLSGRLVNIYSEHWASLTSNHVWRLTFVSACCCCTQVKLANLLQDSMGCKVWIGTLDILCMCLCLYRFVLPACRRTGYLPALTNTTQLSQTSLLHTQTPQLNSNRTSVVRCSRQKYERLYPVMLVRPDGSTVNIRYKEPRRLLMVSVQHLPGRLSWGLAR